MKNSVALRMRMTPDELMETVGNKGIGPGTLKSRMKAEMAWSSLIGGLA